MENKALHIDGPPVISMGRAVTAAEKPMLFAYCQGWQGFVTGNLATQIRKLCLIAEEGGKAIVTPAHNFIPRYHPRDREGRPRGPRREPQHDRRRRGTSGAERRKCAACR